MWVVLLHFFDPVPTTKVKISYKYAGEPKTRVIDIKSRQ